MSLIFHFDPAVRSLVEQTARMPYAFARGSAAWYLYNDKLAEVPSHCARYIDVDGAKYLLLEPPSTNYFLSSKTPATQAITLNATGAWTIWCEGAGSITVAAGTATGTGWGAASEGSPILLDITAAGTITCTVLGSLGFAQCENQPFATSHIVTEDVPVQRNQELNTPDWTANAAFTSALADAGTLIMEWSPNFSDSDVTGQRGLITANSASAANLFFLIPGGSIRSRDGSTSITISPGYSPGDKFLLAIRWGYNPGDGKKFEVGYQKNGGSWVWTGDCAFDGSFDPNGEISLALYNDLVQRFGKIGFDNVVLPRSEVENYSWPIPQYGTTWYVRSGGAGDRDGTSYEHAWDKGDMDLNEIAEGDTIKFDGTWSGKNAQLTLAASGRTWVDWLHLTSYDTTNPATFDVSGEIENSSGTLWSAVTWTEETGLGTDIWSMANGCGPNESTPGRLWIDGAEVVQADAAANVDATYPWYYDGATKKLFIHAPQAPPDEYESIIGNLQGFSVYVYGPGYLDFSHINAPSGYLGGYGFQNGCHHIKVHDFTDVGSKSAQKGIAFSDGDSGSTEIHFYNGIVDRGFRFTEYDHDVGIGDGIGIVGNCRNIYIYNMEVRNCGHTGVQLSVDAGETIENAWIFQNEVDGAETDYMRGFALQAAVGGVLRYVDVFRNNFHDLSIKCHLGGTDNRIFYNQFRDFRNRSHRPGKDTDGAALNWAAWDGQEDIKRNKVLHNLFAFCDEPGFIARPDPKCDIQDNETRNNIFFCCGENSNFTPDRSGVALYIPDDPEYLGNIWTHNLFYSPNTTATVYYRGEAITVSAFNAKNGENGDVVSGNLSSHPRFVNPANNDLGLRRGSPGIDAGIGVGLTEDYEGNPVPRGKAPDIGPFEAMPAGSFLRPTTRPVAAGILQGSADGQRIRGE